LAHRTTPQPLVGSAGSLDDALHSAFVRETQAGVLLAIAVRVIGVGSGLAFYFWNVRPNLAHVPFYRRLFPDPVIFAGYPYDLLGVVLLILAMRSKRPIIWCMVMLVADLIWLWEFKFGWDWRPSTLTDIPLFSSIRYQELISFAILMMVYSLPLSRRVILAAGLGSFLIWIAGIVHTYLAYKHGVLYWGPFGPGIGDAGLRAIQGAETLVVDYFIIQLALIAFLTYVLILSTQEGRRFVTARVRAEVDLAFLARFFPPVIAARMSREGGRRIAPARRHAAILFVDMERARNTQTIDLARLQSY